MSIIRDLTSIKSRISGLYRTNRFFLILLTKNQFNFPLPLDPILVSVVNMPGRSVEDIPFVHGGVNYMIAGDPTFNDLTVRIKTWHYVDFRMMQQWMDAINDPNDNKRLKPSQYKTAGSIGQAGDKSILPLHNLALKGLYPKSISDIEFDTSESTELVSFTVTFNVDSIQML